MNNHRQQQFLNEQQLIVATPASKRNTTTRWITRYFPVRFAHFFRVKCQFDIFWPVAVSMAPRNLQQNGNSISRMTSQEDLASPDATTDKLSDFNWRKTMIQSRIMERVQTVGERISGQSWLEQMRTLAKERSITSILVMVLLGLCAIPVIGFVLTLAFTVLGFLFVEGTLLTIGACLLGGLLVVSACLALPLILVLFITYSLSSLAFNLFSTTSSKLKHMVVPGSESSHRHVIARSPMGKSCTDGSAFLPACITESDSFLEAAVLRRAQMNADLKRLDALRC